MPLKFIASIVGLLILANTALNVFLIQRSSSGDDRPTRLYIETVVGIVFLIAIAAYVFREEPFTQTEKEKERIGKLTNWQ